MLKQLSITIGYFLSFYKEVQNFDDYNFLKSGENHPEINAILYKFNLHEIFTDID